MTSARSFSAPLAAWLAALSLLAGCSSPTADPVAAEASAQAFPDATATADEAAAPATLRPAELGGAAPVHAVGNIYLAGQPQRGKLDQLAERGVRTVVSLRKPEEVDWDERAAVEAAGMTFVAIPFDGPEELTDDVFDRVRAVLAENRDEPLFLHCARSNRVGAVWMVHRVLHDGVSLEQALEEAQTAGLRTPEFIRIARDYIERSQADAPTDAAARPSP